MQGIHYANGAKTLSFAFEFVSKRVLRKLCRAKGEETVGIVDRCLNQKCAFGFATVVLDSSVEIIGLTTSRTNFQRYCIKFPSKRNVLQSYSMAYF